MKNLVTWSGMNPLTIRIKGTGEFVKKEVANLEYTWAEAMVDRDEQIAQDER